MNAVKDSKRVEVTEQDVYPIHMSSLCDYF